jgi:hypothetical protein
VRIKMRKYLALATILVLLFLSTTGCIDIYLARDLLVPREEEVVEYEWQDYNFDHNFSSSPNEPLELYSEEFEVPVKPRTDLMRIDISIEMRSIREVWDAVPNGTLKDLLQDLVEQIFEYADQRYIEITISLPDGFELYKNTFNQTTTAEIGPITSPGEGNWIIEVDAAGVGYASGDLEYHDAFAIKVVLREIKE